MTPARILETLAAAGVTVTRHGDRLRLKPASGNVPGDVVELARAHKLELLQALPDPEALDAMRAHLLAICRSHLLPERLVAELPDADLIDCELLSPEGLVRWLHVLDENRRMRQGIAPDGWTHPSYCRRCGPVLLWQGAPPVVLGCPWCHVRRAGGRLPRPAVTCATCTHQQLRPGTSEAGMHGCHKGNGLHHAHQRHACADWRPVACTVDDRREPTP